MENANRKKVPNIAAPHVNKEVASNDHIDSEDWKYQVVSPKQHVVEVPEIPGEPEPEMSEQDEDVITVVYHKPGQQQELSFGITLDDAYQQAKKLLRTEEQWRRNYINQFTIETPQTRGERIPLEHLYDVQWGHDDPEDVAKSACGHIIILLTMATNKLIDKDMIASISQTMDPLVLHNQQLIDMLNENVINSDQYEELNLGVTQSDDNRKITEFIANRLHNENKDDHQLTASEYDEYRRAVATYHRIYTVHEADPYYKCRYTSLLPVLVWARALKHRQVDPKQWATVMPASYKDADTSFNVVKKVLIDSGYLPAHSELLEAAPSISDLIDYTTKIDINRELPQLTKAYQQYASTHGLEANDISVDSALIDAIDDTIARRGKSEGDYETILKYVDLIQQIVAIEQPQHPSAVTRRLLKPVLGRIDIDDDRNKRVETRAILHGNVVERLMFAGFNPYLHGLRTNVDITQIWTKIDEINNTAVANYETNFVAMTKEQKTWVDTQPTAFLMRDMGALAPYMATIKRHSTTLTNVTLQKIQRFNPWVSASIKKVKLDPDLPEIPVIYCLEIDYQKLAQMVIDRYYLANNGQNYVWAWNFDPDRPNTWVSTPIDKFTVFVDKAISALHLGNKPSNISQGQRAFIVALQNKLSNKSIAVKFDEDSFNTRKAVRVQFENGVLDLYDWTWKDHTDPLDYIPVTIPYSLNQEDIEHVTQLHNNPDVATALKWLCALMGEKYNDHVDHKCIQDHPEALPQSMIFTLTYIGGIMVRQNNITAKGREHRDNYMLLLYSPEPQHGKSALTSQLRRMVSGTHDSDNRGNHVSLTPEALNGSRFSKAILQNMLLDVFDDMNFASKNNASLIKQILGGDSMQAERKNEQEQSVFKPFCKIVCSANGLPKIVDRSGGMPDRMAAIYMPTKIDAKFREDYPLDVVTQPEIVAKLTIISMYLYHIWLRGDKYDWNPYQFSANMKKATQQWVNVSNPSRQVLGELVSYDADGCVNVTLLYKLYQLNMKRNGHTPLTREEFDKSLTLAIDHNNWNAEKARKKKQIPLLDYKRLMDLTVSAQMREMTDPKPLSQNQREELAQDIMNAAYNRANAGADATGSIIDLEELDNTLDITPNMSAQFIKPKRVEVYEGISFNDNWSIVQQYVDDREDISKTPYQDALKQIMSKLTVDDYVLPHNEVVLSVKYGDDVPSSYNSRIDGLMIPWKKWRPKQIKFIQNLRKDPDIDRVHTSINCIYQGALRQLRDNPDNKDAQSIVNKFEKPYKDEL